MTTVTLQLSDTIVSQAKQAGVYNEKTLAEKLHEFLTWQLKQNNEIVKSQASQSSVYDFVMSLPKASYEQDGLQIQQNLRDEW